MVIEGQGAGEVPVLAVARDADRQAEISLADPLGATDRTGDTDVGSADRDQVA